MKGLQKVPVLMYHSVGILNPKWIWSFLTIPYQIFEDHLRVLRKRGFKTIDLLQLHDYVSTGKSIPLNSIALTFDDGYLDNWVYAYPLLRKYGFKGSVFVNPEFVDPTEEYRPNLEDVWMGKAKLNDLPFKGFLSWREMRQMEEDGVMDIQSHAMTHTWYFSGPEIIDFRHPGDEYVWMDWNEFPEKKFNYLCNTNNNPIKWGSPVFTFQKSLECRIYFPDENLSNFVIDHVRKNGGEEFFDQENWKDILIQMCSQYTMKYGDRGRFETDQEYKDRLESELKLSKQIIEEKLNKTVDFLCWPGGGYNDLSLDLSKKYYVASTLSSRDTSLKKNVFGEDPSRVKRIGVPTVVLRNGSDKYLNGFYLYLFLKDYSGNYLHRILRKAFKAYYLVFG